MGNVCSKPEATTKASDNNHNNAVAVPATVETAGMLLVASNQFSGGSRSKYSTQEDSTQQVYKEVVFVGPIETGQEEEDKDKEVPTETDVLKEPPTEEVLAEDGSPVLVASNTTGATAAEGGLKKPQPTTTATTTQETIVDPRQFALENKKDILMYIFSFLGYGHYIYVAGVSKLFKENYLEYCNKKNNTKTNYHYYTSNTIDHKNKTETLYSSAFSTVARAKFWYEVTYRQPLGNTNRQVDHTFSVRVAKYGTVQVMEWVRRQGFPWSSETSRSAAMFGRLEIIRYLHENGCPWDIYTAHEAAFRGHLSCLRYAHENGCDWDKVTCMFATRSGSLNCLQYAHENGCPWDGLTTKHAADDGNLDCLRYAHQNGCPWHEDTCKLAAWHGHLDCLQYAHQNGCPWNEQTCKKALRYGNLHCFNYAIQNGCPCPDRIYELASDAGVKIVQERGRRYLVLPEQKEVIQQLVQQYDGLFAFHEALLAPPSRESQHLISHALIDVNLWE